jgi:hypothetical protein
MSAKTCPTGGFAVKVADLITACANAGKPDLARMLERCVDESGFGHVESLSKKDWLPFAEPCEFYTLDEADIPDADMERGEWYAIYNEYDLFERRYRPEVAAMAVAGAAPAHYHWATVG